MASIFRLSLIVAVLSAVALAMGDEPKFSDLKAGQIFQSKIMIQDSHLLSEGFQVGGEKSSECHVQYQYRAKNVKDLSVPWDASGSYQIQNVYITIAGVYEIIANRVTNEKGEDFYSGEQITLFCKSDQTLSFIESELKFINFPGVPAIQGELNEDGRNELDLIER